MLLFAADTARLASASVHRGISASGDQRPWRASVGMLRLEIAARCRILPFAADQHLICGKCHANILVFDVTALVIAGHRRRVTSALPDGPTGAAA
jgi:hypothetical protein